MERWTAGLADGALTPEDALDRLRDARSHLSGLLKSHGETVIEGFAKTEREAKPMRRKMEDAQEGPDRHNRRLMSPASSEPSSCPLFLLDSFLQLRAQQRRRQRQLC
ncbi:hypothetical protein ABIB27_003339 [Arthrobacter sp. UYEF21]